jgi:hypothetical protein
MYEGRVYRVILGKDGRAQVDYCQHGVLRWYIGQWSVVSKHSTVGPLQAIEHTVSVDPPVSSLDHLRWRGVIHIIDGDRITRILGKTLRAGVEKRTHLYSRHFNLPVPPRPGMADGQL